MSYCNYCGAKLSGASGDNIINSSGVKPELLVSAMVAVFILGLVAIAVLIGVMKAVAAFDLPILLAVNMFSFLLMVAVEGVLIWLLLKGKRGVKEVRIRLGRVEFDMKEEQLASMRDLQRIVAEGFSFP